MKAQHTAEVYNKPFRLQNKDGTVGTIDIEVYRDAESGEEILTQASLAAISKAKIVALRSSQADLLEALQIVDKGTEWLTPADFAKIRAAITKATAQAGGE